MLTLASILASSITRHQPPTFLLIPVGKLRVEANIMSVECCGCMYYGKLVCAYISPISLPKKYVVISLYSHLAPLLNGGWRKVRACASLASWLGLRYGLESYWCRWLCCALFTSTLLGDLVGSTLAMVLHKVGPIQQHF